MTILEAIISGIVQGFTEFLPVSSSGHLVILHNLFGLSEPNIFFDICLHIATLIAVIIFFRKDILGLFTNKRFDLMFYICIATVPAILAALFFEEKIEAFFASAGKVYYMLIITAVIVLAGHFSEFLRKDSERKDPSFLTSLFVGICQAFALLPGISRSGTTISAGLISGIKLEDAFKFSFFLAIPAILGAAVFKSFDIDLAKELFGNLQVYFSGMVTAFLAGYLSLMILWKAIKRKNLYFFSIYCLILGISGILFRL